jgi:hypothetical protein
MYDEETRDAMAKAGEALPDGSFPIKDEDDLKNAIQAYGRAGDKEAAKAHIMKRAAELDMEDMIPENWSEKSEDMEDDEEESEEMVKPEEDMTEGEKSDDAEATKFLADLMEFEMLAVETGIEEQ